MSENKSKKGLGRGLSSLLGDISTAPEPAQMRNLSSAPLDLVRPILDQPRKSFRPAELDELAASIREKGVIQPLIVRRDPERDGGYQIVAGERRWRAAQQAQLHEVPIILKELSDEELLEIALIENVQRADLNSIDEAEGYSQLIERFGHSQADLARAMGKSRPYIANALRLLTLPEDVRELVVDGRISAGHARALITAPDPSALAQRVVAEGLSVRRTEELARHVATPAQGKPPAPRRKDADTKALEGDLSAALGLKVSIDHKSSGGGELRIAYRDLEKLDGLCRLLMG